MKRSEANEYRKLVIDGSSVADLGGISTEITQSDKIGFDWINTLVGGVVVRREYVEQTTPFGTRSNPILYSEGTSLINNAYYIVDGALMVWMDGWMEA